MKPKSNIKRASSDSDHDIQFGDLFILEDIQRLQDLFSDATGVASIITHPDGTPITKPSNFCRLCNNIIRKTEKGLANCFKSDAVLGHQNSSGPIVLPCLSGELWDAGASITVGGKHIANWLIGQVRNEELDEQRMIQYADEIGANREDFMKALAEVPVMSVEQFKKVSKMLFAFANDVSEKAYNNFQQKIHIGKREKAEVLMQESQERASKQSHAIARIAMDEEIALGDMTVSFQRLTEEVANAVQVERASIWLLSADKSVLRCISLFENKKKKHSSGVVLKATDYPRYFKAINHESRISANDAQNDPRSSEFTEGYLAPFGICSMLDAGIHVEGELVGVVCFEHISEKRTWYPDEESFASTVASMVAQILANIKRKNAEIALKESEIKYRELIENSPDAIAIYIEGKIVMINKECLRLMSAVHERDLIGKPVLRFVHPDYQTIVIERMKKAITLGKALPLEIEKFIRLDGTVVDVEVKAMPITIGNKSAVQLIVRDITERRKKEETIAMLAHAIKSISECVSITDLNDKIVFVNSAFLKTYQYEEHELLGNSISIVRSLNNPHELVEEILPATMQGGWQGELMNLRKDGSEFPVFVSSSVIHDETGAPLALIGVTTDITGRRQAEIELNQARNDWENTFEAITDMITIHDKNYNIIRANAAAKKYISLSESENIIMTKCFKYYHGTENPPDGCPSCNCLVTGLPGVFELFEPHLNLFLELRAIPRFDVDKHLIGLVHIVRDITDRKAAEKEIINLNKDLEFRVKLRTAELEDTNRELETFSYSVSHDLQAPLRHIKGFINLFMDQKSTKLTIEEIGYLQKIDDSANEMTKLIDAILSFSRLNKAELRKTSIRSYGLVQQVIKFFEPDMQHRKITFNVEPLPDALGDEELIRQVWTNLISNAIKYTGKKADAVVDIGSISTDNGTTFFVKDNGAGFHMKYSDRLFGVFQRLHKSRDFEGIGIGLANVNRIVKRHGGQCHGESEPEKGATFYFSLPN